MPNESNCNVNSPIQSVSVKKWMSIIINNARSNTTHSVPASAHHATPVHTLSPSAEMMCNRSNTEDTVPRSSIRSRHAHPYHPSSDHSTVAVRVATTSDCGVAVVRRSNPCCTFEVGQTSSTSPGRARTRPLRRSKDSTTKETKTAMSARKSVRSRLHVQPPCRATPR